VREIHRGSERGPVTGLVAVVTGASRGIGRAIAQSLLAGGARVHVVGRDRTALDSLMSPRIEEGPGPVVRHLVDLAGEDVIGGLARAIVATDAGVDILVHAGGKHLMGEMENADPTELDELFRVNVHAPVGLTRALLPALRRAQGQVVFVNSSAGLRATRGIGAYSASKHALRAIADSLRDELNPEGIRVLSVYPGRTATSMQERIFEAEGRPYRPELLLQPEDIASIVLCALTLPRTAEVTDIAIRPLQKT
jgi:NADP-dependent 3-hydroxy acid dehydrogenase YdfG